MEHPRIVDWRINDLFVYFIEDRDWNLVTTVPIVAPALNVTANNINKMCDLHSDELSGLRVNSIHSKNISPEILGFLRSNRKRMGMTKIMPNARVLTEDDVLLLAMLSKTPEGRSARRGFLPFIKEHVSKRYATNEQVEQATAPLRAEIEELRSMIMGAQPHLQSTASSLGRGLRAQRETLPLRIIPGGRA